MMVVTLHAKTNREERPGVKDIIGHAHAMNGSVKPARKLAMHVRVTLVHATTVKLLATAQNLATTGTLIVTVVGTNNFVTGSLLTIGMCRVVPALATSVNQ